MSESAQAVDWQARYAAGTTPWERAEPNPAFLSWRASAVLTPGRILVPGAGRSHEPLLLAEAGFTVTVVDAAPDAVAAQQAALAGFEACVEQADLLGWDAPLPFDAIYDQTCLCALPPAVWPAYVARLALWLRPGGVLAVLFMQTGQGGGPPFHCDLAQMRHLFAADGWAWPDSLQATIGHPNGLFEQPVALRRR